MYTTIESLTVELRNAQITIRGLTAGYDALEKEKAVLAIQVANLQRSLGMEIEKRVAADAKLVQISMLICPPAPTPAPVDTPIAPAPVDTPLPAPAAKCVCKCVPDAVADVAVKSVPAPKTD